MNMDTINHSEVTAQKVQEILQTGNFEQAVEAAKQVLENNPDDVYCLSVLANANFSAGEYDEAENNLKKAVDLNPQDWNLIRNLGLLYNKTGKYKSSVECYLKGIADNMNHPDVMLDLLLLGISLYKISEEAGLRAIKHCLETSQQLKMAFMNNREIPLISEASGIANQLLRNYRYISQKKALQDVISENGGDDSRLNKFLDLFHGLEKPEFPHPMQKPTYHFFPGLDPVTFYESDQFAWAKELEGNYKEIKRELLSLYDDKQSITPYINKSITGNEGLDTLADSLDWSAIHLIKAGEKNPELMAMCPVTSEILSHLPLPNLAGNAPEVFLSVLKPGTEIKPHYGLSNIKMTVHLGLEIPENCAIRVGENTSSWEEGKVLIFDDTFEHEAWNKSDTERKVLIVEVWNPGLTEVEKKGIEKMMEMQHEDYMHAINDSVESILQEVKTIINN